MIRFSCPTCHRKSALPDALARVPLLCKGCGQRVVPAEVGMESGDALVVEDEPDRSVAEAPPVFPTDEPRGDLERKPDAAPTEPPAAVAPTEPPAAPGERRALGLVVDVAVGLVLAGVGVLLGEFAAGKSTATIVNEAVSAPKFPPTDLVLWVGCVAVPLLGYALLANRGTSVGGWLRRRGV